MPSHKSIHSVLFLAKMGVGSQAPCLVSVVKEEAEDSGVLLESWSWGWGLEAGGLLGFTSQAA